MKLVVDASVALKWFFQDRANEPDTGPALALLAAVADGQATLIQPPHFIAEVSAVLAREAPKTAQGNLRDLLAVQMLVNDDPAVYARAIELAVRHRHHVFDTLYHALALHTPGAVLVTADARYWRKAGGEGGLLPLARFAVAD